MPAKPKLFKLPNLPVPPGKKPTAKANRHGINHEKMKIEMILMILLAAILAALLATVIPWQKVGAKLQKLWLAQSLPIAECLMLDFSNLAEGVHEETISLIPDTTALSNMPVRFLIATLSATGAKYFTVCNATLEPIGIVWDMAPVLITSSQLALPPLAIKLLGAVQSTRKVAINSTVGLYDFLCSDSAGYGRTLPAAGATPSQYYVIGKALQSGVAGDTIEFDPQPMIVRYGAAAGTVTQTQNSITDSSGGTAATPSAGVRTIAAVTAASTDTSAARLTTTANAIADLAAELNLVKADIAALNAAFAEPSGDVISEN